MIEETKPAIKSIGIISGTITTIGGLLLGFHETLSSLLTIMPDIVKEIAPVLPVPVVGKVLAITGVIGILNRKFGSTKSIQGVFTSPEK